jgi:hypothetical protein
MHSGLRNRLNRSMVQELVRKQEHSWGLVHSDVVHVAADVVAGDCMVPVHSKALVRAEHNRLVPVHSRSELMHRRQLIRNTPIWLDRTNHLPMMQAQRQ